MKSLKFLVFYFAKLTQRYKKRLLVGLVFVSLLLTFFLNIPGLDFLKKNLQVKGYVIEGLVGTYTERDLPTIVTGLLSSGLVTLDKDGSPRPNLVTGWEISSDGKQYKFKLRKDLEWTDGTSFKSSDLEFRLSDVEIYFPDDETIEFKLADTYSPFPTLLTKPLFKKGTYTGVGPYKLERLNRDIVFVSQLMLSPTKENFPFVNIKFYPNEQVAKTALKLGEIQVLLGLNEGKDLNLQDESKPFKLQENINYTRLVTIFYNTQDPILADENLRLALSFAAPSIPEEIEARTSISPHSWAFNKEVKDYLDNFDLAKNYLKKAQNNGDLKITLTATTHLKEVGEKVVESWKKIGINGVLRVESGIPQNFQVLLITHNIPPDPDQYSLWHSTQSQSNLSKYSYPRIDKNLEDGRKVLGIEKRLNYYKDFQKVLLDHAPATFLYFPKYNIVYLKKIEANLNKIINFQIENL